MDHNKEEIKEGLERVNMKTGGKERRESLLFI